MGAACSKERSMPDATTTVMRPEEAASMDEDKDFRVRKKTTLPLSAVVVEAAPPARFSKGQDK
jgi:hypothetical protein